MDRTRLIIVCLLFSFVAMAQNQEKNFDQQVFILDYNGKPFEKYSPDIQGTPFFYDTFFNAILILHNGKKMDSVKARMDFYKQEIDLKLGNDIEMVTAPGMIKEVLLQDSVEQTKVLYKFRSGFPPIDGQNGNNYYQVLSESKILFIKSIQKKIIETKNELSGEITKAFETYDEYYIVINNEIRRVKRNNQFFIDLLSDKKGEIAKFVSDNKINCKYMDKAERLIDYYNSLF